MKEIILAGIRCSLFYILSSFFSTIETSSPRCWPPGGPLHVSSGQCFKLCNCADQGQAGTSASSAPAQPFLVILTSASPTPQPLPLTSRMIDTGLSESLPWNSFPSCFHSLFHPMAFWKAFFGLLLWWCFSPAGIMHCFAAVLSFSSGWSVFHPWSLYSYRSLSHPRGAARLTSYKLPLTVQLTVVCSVSVLPVVPTHWQSDSDSELCFKLWIWRPAISPLPAP